MWRECTAGATRRCSVALVVLGLMVVTAAGCGDTPTDFGDDSNCELIFTTQGQGANPTTVIKVINRLGGGLSVQVDALNVALVGVGADMAPNTCELYGLLPDLYDVTLQQCEQGNPGSSECTQLLGVEVVRRIDLQLDQTETVEVTESFF